jgi:hypothetical protein
LEVSKTNQSIASPTAQSFQTPGWVFALIHLPTNSIYVASTQKRIYPSTKQHWYGWACRSNHFFKLLLRSKLTDLFVFPLEKTDTKSDQLLSKKQYWMNKLLNKKGNFNSPSSSSNSEKLSPTKDVSDLKKFQHRSMSPVQPDQKLYRPKPSFPTNSAASLNMPMHTNLETKMSSPLQPDQKLYQPKPSFPTNSVASLNMPMGINLETKMSSFEAKQICESFSKTEFFTTFSNEFSDPKDDSVIADQSQEFVEDKCDEELTFELLEEDEDIEDWVGEFLAFNTGSWCMVCCTFYKGLYLYDCEPQILCPDWRCKKCNSTKDGLLETLDIMDIRLDFLEKLIIKTFKDPSDLEKAYRIMKYKTGNFERLLSERLFHAWWGSLKRRGKSLLKYLSDQVSV